MWSEREWMNFMQFVLRIFCRKGYCLTQDVNEASDLFDCLYPDIDDDDGSTVTVMVWSVVLIMQ